MPGVKGKPRSDVALRNKLAKGQKKSALSNVDIKQDALTKINELENEQAELETALTSHGVPLPKGWKPVDIIRYIRQSITPETIGKMISNNTQVMQTHSSAIAANSFTQYILELAMGEKEDRIVQDEVSGVANIIVFGKGTFQGVDDL